MDRNIQRIGSINVATMFLIGLFSWFTANYAVSLSALAGSIFMTLGFLVCVVSWFQMRLEAREKLEKMEFDELSKSKDSSALFASDGESFEAKRSREQFEKYVVPAFTIFLFIAEVVAVWQIWRLTIEPKQMMEDRAIVCAAFYAGFFLVFFLMGQYSASLARFENQRLMRPGGSFMLLSSFVALIIAAVEAAAFFGFVNADVVVARILCVILGLVACETLLALMFEIYRPRMKGKEVHLLYDSRLVGLLGQPGGIFSTAAQAIDYQFGFKVSETWFYRVLERAIVWIVLIQLGALMASTMMVIIKPHEQALIERFGKPARAGKIIEPGLHFKLPWPFEKVYRHNPGEIQIINVGFVPKEHTDNPKKEPILWTVQHYEEESKFLVASREQITSGQTNETKAVPVNLITASIPVHFLINDLNAWEYGHADGARLLQSLATREVVRYCVNVDIAELMTSGRLTAAKTLQERMQKRADDLEMGVEIVFVGLQDIHPPMGKDGSSPAVTYEDVNKAVQEREATILQAKAEAADSVPAAKAEAASLISMAEGYRMERTAEASSIAARFTNQITAFTAAPNVFSKRTHLNAIAQSTRGARKYIVAVTNTTDVVTFNLEDKIHQDLLDVEVEVPDAEKK